MLMFVHIAVHVPWIQETRCNVVISSKLQNFLLGEILRDSQKTQETSGIYKAQEAYEICQIYKALPQGYIISKLLLGIGDYLWWR